MRRFNPNWQRPRKRGNPEGQLQLQIIHYLKAKGYIIGKTKTTGIKRGNAFCFDPYCFRGKCDLECFANGVMYGIEVKSKVGKLSPEQIHYKEVFHKPPDRIFIEAHCLEDVISAIK
jgi:hypothetical protein